MSRFSKVAIALFLMLGGLSASTVRAQGLSSEIPELKVLNHYAGKWDGTMTFKPNGDEKGTPSTGSSTGEWIHDGRFLRQTWSLKGSDALPAMNGSTIMTYDPQKKTYRSWNFTSTGQMAECQGAWDAKSKTMTWTMRDDGNGGASVTKASFPEDGVESWSILVKDGSGKVVADLNGKNTRRAK